MKKIGLANKLNAAVVALGLSLAPAKEVDSGVSYGGSIGIDLNKNVSVGGYVTSTDKANSLFGKMGLNYILLGKDKGHLSLGIGGGYVLENGLSPSIEGSYTPKSESPFSIGVGLGYSLVKKDGENGAVNEGVEESIDCGEGVWIEDEGHCECLEEGMSLGQITKTCHKSF